MGMCFETIIWIPISLDSILWDEHHHEMKSHHERENMFGSLFPSIQQANLINEALFSRESCGIHHHEKPPFEGRIWVLPKIMVPPNHPF